MSSRAGEASGEDTKNKKDEPQSEAVDPPPFTSPIFGEESNKSDSAGICPFSLIALAWSR
jgi:hypothetical protein